MSDTFALVGKKSKRQQGFELTLTLNSILDFADNFTRERLK